jgi:RNA 3'-phosphate cyclase
VHIGTAGAIGLVYQILSIACVGFHADQGDKIEINVDGGATYGKWAPPVSYTKNILVPLLGRLGFSSDISVKHHGFYPKGGAAAKITFYPVDELLGIDLSDRGTIDSIEGDSVASANLRNAHVADRQATSLVDSMKASFPGVKSHVIANYVDALNPGSGIVAWAKTSTGCVIGSDAIGEQHLAAEKVGKECARGLIKVLSGPATVDEYASDQLIPFLMLSHEHSRLLLPELTNHAKTNIEIIKNYFIDRQVSIDEQPDHVVLDFPALE